MMKVERISTKQVLADPLTKAYCPSVQRTLSRRGFMVEPMISGLQRGLVFISRWIDVLWLLRLMVQK